MILFINCNCTVTSRTGAWIRFYSALSNSSYHGDVTSLISILLAWFRSSDWLLSFECCFLIGWFPRPMNYLAEYTVQQVVAVLHALPFRRSNLSVQWTVHAVLMALDWLVWSTLLLSDWLVWSTLLPSDRLVWSTKLLFDWLVRFTLLLSDWSVWSTLPVSDCIVCWPRNRVNRGPY